METDKKECPTCIADTQIQKTSDILDIKGEVQAFGTPEVDDVDEVDKPQTVVTTLSTEVGSLESSNNIHVQLFDGQVIHITSAHLEETEGGRKACEVDMKQSESSVVTGELGSGEGTVTLLTSNGKTYILPQPLSTAEGGSYLISNEVLSAEEVLHSDNVLHEEQILTISPPPPPQQSALNIPTSVASQPDALAIATSEVFSEDYVPVPLKAQRPVAQQSNALRFKTSNSTVTQEINCTSVKEDSLRSSLLPDARIITITASDSGGSDEWLEQRSCFTAKRTLKKNVSEVFSSKAAINLSAARFKVKEERDCNEVRQIQLNSTSSSPTCSKWVGLQDNMSSKLKAVTAAAKGFGATERAGDSKLLDVTTKAVRESKEKNKKDVQTADSENVQETTFRSELQDKKNLRRSSRIKKVKKMANEVGLRVVHECCCMSDSNGRLSLFIIILFLLNI